MGEWDTVIFKVSQGPSAPQLVLVLSSLLRKGQCVPVKGWWRPSGQGIEYAGLCSQVPTVPGMLEARGQNESQVAQKDQQGAPDHPRVTVQV